MSPAAVPRRLLPLYTFLGRTFCWQCSFCAKQFMVAPMDTDFFREDTSLDAVPDEVRRAFDRHDCRWVLFAPEQKPA
jgi:hypothetical protein